MTTQSAPRDPADVANALSSFLSQFLHLDIASTDEPIGREISSMQQFELLIFIESEFGVTLSHEIFTDAGAVTIERLANAICAAAK